MDAEFVGSCGRVACWICWQSIVVTHVKESADFGLMAELIDDLLDCYVREADDNSYHQAILDGLWPSAVQQLEAALIKAKAGRGKDAE